MAKGVLAAVGRFCFRFRWLVLAVWILLAVGGGLMAPKVFETLADNSNPSRVESVEAYDVINAGNDSSGQVIGLVDRIDPAAPAVRDTVSAAATEIAALAHVKRVDSPFSAGLPPERARALVAQDQHGLLVSA